MAGNNNKYSQMELGRRGGAGRFAEIEKAENAGATLKRLMEYLATEKMLLFWMLFTVILSTALGIIAPSLQSNAIDIISGTREGNLIVILIVMLVTYLFNGIGNLFQSRLSAYLSQRIVRKMRGKLFNHIIDLPIGFIDSHSHGDLMSRMSNDIENVSNTVSQSIVSLFSG
ncbi:MAG: hypothetical protein J6W04_00370, partial [Bacteroidales bacterium]|nr:hypothetical protein [Bacteroidales bacterium]